MHVTAWSKAKFFFSLLIITKTRTGFLIFCFNGVLLFLQHTFKTHASIFKVKLWCQRKWEEIWMKVVIVWTELILRFKICLYFFKTLACEAFALTGSLFMKINATITLWSSERVHYNTTFRFLSNCDYKGNTVAELRKWRLTRLDCLLIPTHYASHLYFAFCLSVYAK